MKKIRVLLTLLLAMSLLTLQAARLKDISEIKGIRSNQLLGYGLVVGLNDTGDDKSASFTIQSLANMLRNMGVTIDSTSLDVGNCAAVIVTAELPPFAKAGSRLDILVSSLGNADSLQGGTLLMTPLKGPDGKVYALAQGPLTIGGFSLGGGGGGNKVQKNFPTVGRVVNGANIEREIPMKVLEQPSLTLMLNNPDFSTSEQVRDKIQKFFELYRIDAKPKAIDSGTIVVPIPEEFKQNPVGLIAKIENLDVVPDVPARLVVDERTGTIVMGQNVKISTVAVAHGNLQVTIKENLEVSQPEPMSETGNTEVIAQQNLQVSEENERFILLEQGADIKDLIQALNSIGATPRDLISILQAIKTAGALQAELKLM